MATKPKQKAFTFGTCALDHYGPAPLSANTRAINVVVGFEEALKLHFAIGEGLSALNKHNRAARAGRDAAINLTVFLDVNRITVNPGKVRTKRAGGGDDAEVHTGGDGA
jgi:hypothetical protein